MNWMEDIQLVQEQILHAIKGTPDLDLVQELVRLQETGMERLLLADKVNVYCEEKTIIHISQKENEENEIKKPVAIFL